MRTRFPHAAIQLALLFGLVAAGCFYGLGTSMDPPKLKPGQSMPEAPYLIYIHGTLLERNAPGARRDEYGHFNYETILNEFNDRGFYVMSEIRKQRFAPEKYAAKVASLVDELKKKGVPSNHISLMGLDRGARIALIASTMINDPQVNYVLLAGCPVDRSKILLTETTREYGAHYSGNFLSIRSPRDPDSGSCEGLFNQADNATADLEYTPETKKSKELFYSPDPAWVDKAAQWMEMRAGL